MIDPGAHSILSPVSPQGHATESLYWLIFWICTVVFVLVLAALTRGSVRSHVDPTAPPLPIVENEAADRRAAWWVGTAVGITILVLFAVLALSIVTGTKVEAVQQTNAVSIEVTGHQWWWEVSYPNTEADLTITTANEIHVPIHVPVAIVTHSADVIHSFWAPSVTGKRDLLPGYASAFSFQIETPGVYRGQCAEFCGMQHAHMGFSIVAESPNDFANWERRELESAHEPVGEPQAHGRDVFLSHSCVLCHTIRGTSAGSRLGPDLTHLATRKMIAAETLPNTTGNLAGWILDPQEIKPGNHMAANALAPGDLSDLLAYLSSLN